MRWTRSPFEKATTHDLSAALDGYGGVRLAREWGIFRQLREIPARSCARMSAPMAQLARPNVCCEGGSDNLPCVGIFRTGVPAPTWREVLHIYGCCINMGDWYRSLHLYFTLLLHSTFDQALCFHPF